MGYINIDWKYRNDYYNTNSNNCIIPLNNKIEIKQYIKLLSLIIPKTIYLINTTNNKLKIKFADNTILNIVIPINNYDVDSLAIQIKTLINYSNFNMVFDSNKYIYTMTANQNFNIDFTSDFNLLLGMKKIIYYWNNNILLSGIINFLHPISVYIDINDIESWYIWNNNINANFIVPFNTERFGIYEYNNQKNYEQINNLERWYILNSLKIWLYDSNGNLLDFNNSDYTLILEYY